MKQVTFSEIANLVTKNDNKIDEKDAQKARDLGLSFVIAGMNEEEFNNAAKTNQKDIEVYINNAANINNDKSYWDTAIDTTTQIYRACLNGIKRFFSSSSDEVFNKNGELNVNNFKKAVENIIKSYPGDVEKQDAAIKQLLGSQLKTTEPIRGAEREYELKDGTIILDTRGSVFDSPETGTISVLSKSGKETEIYHNP